MSKIDELKAEETESSEAFDELAYALKEFSHLVDTACGQMARSDSPDHDWVKFPKESIRRMRELAIKWS